MKKAGGAEQYHANTKYTEAVAVAAEACADDTKGQTCYICTQALHWKTKEGLVRGCSCRGTAGFAHVSCLAEQAKILCAEAEENNLGSKVFSERWVRWYACSLCEQDHHGVVRCALGWACWKTYVGRPETDVFFCNAMKQLGNGLTAAGDNEDALSVSEAELSILRRLDAGDRTMLIAQNNLAGSYHKLGRLEQAVSLQRDVYYGWVKLYGEEHEQALRAANNYADSLRSLRRYAEAKSLLRETIPVARRIFGENHELTLKMRWNYAMTLYQDTGATLDDLGEAVTTLEETERAARRLLGGAHPTVSGIERNLRNARARRAALIACEGDVDALREALEAMTPESA